MPLFPWSKSKSSKQSKSSAYPQEEKDRATPLNAEHSLNSSGSRDGLEQNFNTYSEAVEHSSRRQTQRKYVFGAGVAGAAAGFLVMGPLGLVVGGGLASAAGARASAKIFKRFGKNGRARPNDEPATKLSLRRARLMERWARLQLNDLDEHEHRLADKGQVLDYVISEFSPWAEAFVNAKTERESAEAAVHLRPLLRLLNAPGVAEVLEQANSLWESEWQSTSSPSLHSMARADVVLPTLVVLPETAGFCLTSKSRKCMPLKGSSKLVQPSVRVIGIARWSAEFIEKHDIDTTGKESVRKDSGNLSEFQSISDFHSLPSIPQTPPAARVDRDRFKSENALPDGCEVPPAGAEDDSDCDHSDSEEIRSVVTAVSKTHTGTSMSSRSSPPGELRLSGLARNNSASEDHSYDECDATEFQVRGPTYLTDGIKVSSEPSLASLCTLDMLKCASSEELPWHASECPNSAVEQLRTFGEKRFLFVIHFRLTPLQFVIVFAIPNKLPESAGAKLLWDFIKNFTDEERKERLKVIPRVPEGPFLARQAVPQKPAILEKKLDCRFFHKPGDHFEISVDVFSSFAVQYACSQVLGAARRVTIDVGFIIEAKEATELPEVCLGIFRARRIDVGQARSSCRSL